MANYCGFCGGRICNLQLVNFQKNDIFFLVKFLLIFLVLYYGTYAFIGLSEKGGYYIALLHYFDYVSWYRTLLLHAAEHWLLTIGDYVFVQDRFYLNVGGKLRIQLVFGCLGIGVISFWVAFVVADVNSGPKRKWIWVIGGIILITIFNITRIVLLAKALYNHWPLLAKIEHHSLYNYCVYGLVIVMIFLFKRTRGLR